MACDGIDVCFVYHYCCFFLSAKCDLRLFQIYLGVTSLSLRPFTGVVNDVEVLYGTLVMLIFCMSFFQDAECKG